MSKELDDETKYELNVYARQLNKDLSTLMDYLRNQDKDNKAILYVGKHIKKKVILPYEEYQKMCQRLESIDNARASEALRCLSFLKGEAINDIACLKNSVTTKTLYQLYFANFDTIEQSLLKAQENEKVLEILKPDLRLVGNFLQARMPLVEDNDRWIIVKEITDEEELESLKKILGQTQI